MTEAATLASYARARGVARETVRRWIERGAPCLRRGGRGPGQGTLVDPAALDAWRGLSREGREQVLQQVAESLLETLLRDAGEGAPAHVSLGIPRRAAAALLALAFGRISRHVLGQELEREPVEIARICGIAENA